MCTIGAAGKIATRPNQLYPYPSDMELRERVTNSNNYQGKLQYHRISKILGFFPKETDEDSDGNPDENPPTDQGVRICFQKGKKITVQDTFIKCYLDEEQPDESAQGSPDRKFDNLDLLLREFVSVLFAGPDGSGNSLSKSIFDIKYFEARDLVCEYQFYKMSTNNAQQRILELSPMTIISFMNKFTGNLALPVAKTSKTNDPNYWEQGEKRSKKMGNFLCSRLQFKALDSTVYQTHEIKIPLSIFMLPQVTHLNCELKLEKLGFVEILDLYNISLLTNFNKCVAIHIPSAHISASKSTFPLYQKYLQIISTQTIISLKRIASARSLSPSYSNLIDSYMQDTYLHNSSSNSIHDNSFELLKETDRLDENLDDEKRILKI